MKAKDAMTRNVVCINPEDSISEAYSLMNEWGIRHLPVVEDENLVGIISDRDVLTHSTPAPTGLDIPSITVAEVMTTDPITCKATTTIAAVGEAMLEHKIDSLPVVNGDGTLVGLVTSSDLIELLVAKEYVPYNRPIPFRFEVLKRLKPVHAGPRPEFA